MLWDALGKMEIQDFCLFHVFFFVFSLCNSQIFFPLQTPSLRVLADLHDSCFWSYCLLTPQPSIKTFYFNLGIHIDENAHTDVDAYVNM